MSDITSLQEVRLKKEFKEIAEQETGDNDPFVLGIYQASDELRNHGEYMLKLFVIGRAEIRHASPELQENEIIVMEAMKNNGYAIALLLMYLQARSDVQEASRESIEAIHRKFGNRDAVVSI